MNGEGITIPHIPEGELDVMIYEALFNGIPTNQDKIEHFIFCILDRNDIQSLLGLSSLLLLKMDKPDFYFFPLCIEKDKINHTIIKLLRKYNDKINDLQILCIGDKINIKDSILSVNSNVKIFKTFPRDPIPKSIPESLFEDFILGHIQETDSKILDYKIVSDLSLTLLNKNNLDDINVDILLSKTMDMLLFFNLHPHKDREAFMDFIQNELHKYIILLGAPY